MDIQLKKRIMRRVWLTFIKRKFFSGAALRSYSLIFLAWQTLAKVSVAHVLANTPNITNGNLVVFYKYAFLGTEHTVQLALLGFAILFIWATVKGIFGVFYTLRTTPAVI